MKHSLKLGLISLLFILTGCGNGQLRTQHSYNAVSYETDSVLNVYGDNTLIYSGSDLADAYAAMDYEKGDYTIKLNKDTGLYITELPAAKSITFDGYFADSYDDLKNFYNPDLSPIFFGNDISLNSDLSFVNCNLTSAIIDLNNYTLNGINHFAVTADMITNGSMNLITTESDIKMNIKSSFQDIDLSIGKGSFDFDGTSLSIKTLELATESYVRFMSGYTDFYVNELIYAPQSHITFNQFVCKNTTFNKLTNKNNFKGCLIVKYEYKENNVPFFTVLTKPNENQSLVLYLYGTTEMRVTNDSFGDAVETKTSIGPLDNIKILKWPELKKSQIWTIWVEAEQTKHGFMLRTAKEEEYTIIDGVLQFN